MSTKQNIKVALVILAMTVGACSQNSTISSTDLQDQIDKAKRQLELEQAKKDIAAAQQGQAEAQAAAFKAKMGSIDTSNLPKGTITTDDKVNIEANYLAYAAADAAAEVIADLIKQPVCQENLGFYTGKDQDAVQAYLVFKQQLDDVQRRIKAKRLTDPVNLQEVPSSVLAEPTGSAAELYTLQTLSQPPPPLPGEKKQTVIGGGFTPLADVASAINAATGLISLFKVDTSFNGVTVASDDLALQALVAAKIRSKCWSNNPGMLIIHPTFAYNTGQSQLLTQVQGLYDTADKFNQQAASLEQFVGSRLAAAATSLGKQQDRLAALQTELDAIAKQLQGHPSSSDKKKLQKQQADDLQERHKIGNSILNDAYESGLIPNKPGPDSSPKEVHDARAALASRYQDDQFTVSQRTAELRASATRISDLITAMSKPDASGVAPLQAILRAEKLQKSLTSSSYLLATKIITVGGNNINKKYPFWSTLSFSGGIVAEYLLTNNSGAIVESGTVECYGGRVKEADLQDTGLNQAKRISCTPNIGPATQVNEASTKKAIRDMSPGSK